MLVAQFAHYLNIDVNDVEQLMALPAAAIYDDPFYQELVQSINPRALEGSAHIVRAIYEENLGEIKAEYNLTDTVMSGYTLVNWVLGFMMYPERMRDMLSVHTSVPSGVVADMLPRLVDLLEDLPENREDWQRALLIFSLPLVAQR